MTAIPQELRARDQWVLWTVGIANGRETKVPYCARGGRASSTDPRTWAPYTDAVAVSSEGKIGYVLSPDDPYVMIDLDGCVAGGRVDPAAMEIVREIDSYTEISPSRRGLRIFCRGELLCDRNRTSKTPWGDEFEIYAQDRFATTTGDVFEGRDRIRDGCTDAITAVCSRMFPPAKKEAKPKAKASTNGTGSDADVLRLAMSAKNGAKFSQLWTNQSNGDGGDKSESAGDLALCNHLAFWAGPDHARIDGLFRQSARADAKWERDDYSTATITKAIDGCKEFYDWAKVETIEGTAEDLPSVDPPPTVELLIDIGKFFQRFVVLPSSNELLAVSLFTLHTWAFDSAHCTPFLAVESPEKQSGKTRLLEVLNLVCRNAVMAASITAAGVYQVVEAWQPTLLIDEADAVFGGNDELTQNLRGVLNAGNAPGANVIRGAKDGKPLKHGVYCPKVIAGIKTGKLPDTIRDRSIIVPIDRKLKEERTERLRRRQLQDEVKALKAKLQAWAAEHHDTLAAYELSEPMEQLSDRLEEAWEPLLAIAALGGDEWEDKAKVAAVALAEGDVDNTQAAGHRLLFALKEIFGAREVMSSSDIVDRLNLDAYYAGWNSGKGMNPYTLSKQLNPYRIAPRKVWIGDRALQGYPRAAFERVWARYSGRPEDPSPRAKSGEKSPEGFSSPSGLESSGSPINTGVFRPSGESRGDTPTHVHVDERAIAEQLGINYRDDLR